MFNSVTKSARVRAALTLLYAFLCLSSVFTGLGLNRGGPMGYLSVIESHFRHFAQARTDPVFRLGLMAIDVLLFLAFLPGLIGAFILVMLIMLVLVILGWIFLGLAKIAGISLGGAILVYAVVVIIIAALLRRHWGAIAEAAAWLFVSVEGLWKLFVPQTQPSMARSALRHVFTPVVSSYEIKKAPEGSFFMARKDNNIQKGPQSAPLQDTLSNLLSQPVNVFGALTSKIKAQMTAKAYKEQAEMISSANQVATQLLAHHDLETDAFNAGSKREVKMTRQELETLRTHDELEDYKQSRAEKTAQPRNPIELQFETEFKPTRGGDIRKPLYEAETSAETLLQAASQLKKLQKQVDDNDSFSPEEKRALKKQLRSKFDDVLGKEE